MTDREIDIRIVELIMGGFIADPDALADIGEVWYWLHPKDGVLRGEPYQYKTNPIWDHQWEKWQPSIDIRAAMQAAEAAATAPHWLGVTVSTFGIPHAKCYRDSKQVAEVWVELNDIPDTRSLSVRCARALCLAMLQAVGVPQ